MRVIGFAIKKSELWFSVLDGNDRTDANIVHIDKMFFNPDMTCQELMLHFNNIFLEIIDRFTPNLVSYKVHLNSDLSQLEYMQFPLGILNYICKLKNIPAIGRSSAWISSGGKAKLDECSTFFGTQNLRAEKLAATLIAWYQFPLPRN